MNYKIGEMVTIPMFGMDAMIKDICPCGKYEVETVIGTTHKICGDCIVPLVE